MNVPIKFEVKRKKVNRYMAIGKINRSVYIQALLGIVWASSVSAQSGDFRNSSDLLQPLPRSIGTLTESDPLMAPETRAAIRGQYGQKASSKALLQAAAVDKSEEDAILAEAERLLKNEFLNRPTPLPKSLASKASAQVGDELIRLSVVGGRLQIEPAVLNLSLKGGEASVSVQGLETVPQVFLRDGSKLQWDGKRFRGLVAGQTEIYFVYANEMYILPVRVGDSPQKGLVADLGGQRLSGLKMPESFAQMVGVGGLTPASNRGDLSIAEASLQVHRTKDDDAAQQKRFVYSGDTPTYRDTAIQVMDVRSDASQGKIYPMAGVTVQLMGLGLSAKTDATGLARFADLPAGARLWAMIGDEQGRIVPTANEIVISAKGKAQVQRVRTMAYQTYENYLNVFGANHSWANGSICARALEHTGVMPLAGLSVQINDENAEGPYYFSEHGPQPGQNKTGDNGRFCFFNVKPGLAEISFFQGSKFDTALTLPVFPGAHSEEELPLSTGRASNLYLASYGSAMDQLTGDDKIANILERITHANVISVGENDTLPTTAEGVLSNISERSEFKGRTYTLVQTAEFENTLQAQDRETLAPKQMPVLPLLPRGFVEDVFNELNQQSDHASIAFDSAMGQLVVMHKLESQEDASKLTITVIDAYGKTIDEGWYFGSSSQGVVKAVFFNMQPGVYSIKVQSQDGALSAMDTVAIDFWTTALVQTGGTLQYDLSTPDVTDEESN